MSFIKSFTKKAEDNLSASGLAEKQSVAKVKGLGIGYMPDLDEDTVKVGDRVYYYGETGWKEGEDAAHTKGCDNKDHDHFSKDWATEAVRNGDKGTVTAVKKKSYRSPDIDVKWDRHPKCSWVNYALRDLKAAYKGFEITLRIHSDELHLLPKLAQLIKAKAAPDGVKFEIKKDKLISSAKDLVVKTFNLDLCKYLDENRFNTKELVSKLIQSTT